MSFVQRLTQWEGIVFGFIVGIAATVVGSMAYNEISGTLRVSHLRRSLHNNQLEEIATLMEQELAAATTAMKDGRPLQISNSFGMSGNANRYTSPSTTCRSCTPTTWTMPTPCLETRT